MNDTPVIGEPRIVSRRRAERMSGCEGKNDYGSFTRAAKIAKQARRKNHVLLNPYHCPYCFGWHLAEVEKIG